MTQKAELTDKRKLLGHVTYIVNVGIATPQERLDKIIKAIKEAPVVSNKSLRPHGNWIGKPIAGYGIVRCSNCRSIFMENSGKWSYCPNCGAKMEE